MSKSPERFQTTEAVIAHCRSAGERERRIMPPGTEFTVFYEGAYGNGMMTIISVPDEGVFDMPLVRKGDLVDIGGNDYSDIKAGKRFSPVEHR